jgi:integrase
MARQVRNAKLDTRTARARLPSRREPFWTVISAGCALGYRQGAKGGTWIGKFRDDQGRRHYDAFGAADDNRDADGLSVFSFAQAQEQARAFFIRKAREVVGDAAPHDGPFTIEHAVDDYLKAYERRGGRAVYHARRAAETHIIPSLGSLLVTKLSTKRLEGWHQGLAENPARMRPKRSLQPNFRKIDRSPEGVRRRRSTANRILTVLKAALNHAWKSGHVGSDDAWRRVKPFKAVDAARVRYLNESECVRLVNASERPFCDLVRGALLTGCRYAELASMLVADFNPDAGIVTVRTSKSGKSRHPVLTSEGHELFTGLTAGRLTTDPIFRRADGERWNKSQQLRRMRHACEAAKIHPLVSFNVLRHTHGSILAMRGVPMGVIAKQLGHADTRMTEKHYAHLAPSYVSDTIRASFPKLGISGDTTVAPIHRRLP